MLSFDEARARLVAAAHPLAGVEWVDLAHALGRVLAQDLMAPIDVPGHDNAQMDGYAVRVADTGDLPVRLPVAQRITPGRMPPALAPGTAARIFTGAPIPAACDAVVMQEDCTALEGAVEIRIAPRAGQWIRRTGSDISAGSRVLAAGCALRPQHLGIAASLGLARLPLVPRLRVAVLGTGDELHLPGTALPPGGIYNSNRYVLRGLLEALGCVLVEGGVVRDTLAATCAALESATAGADCIITTGGVSAGEEDHVRAAIAALGQLQLWKIAMRPGMPLALGEVRGVPLIGLPGNPVAAFVTFVMLARPFLLARMGVRAAEVAPARLRADFALEAVRDREQFLRVRRNPEGGLDCFPNQGSAVLSSVTWADGLCRVGAGVRVAPGDLLAFHELLPLTGPA